MAKDLFFTLDLNLLRTFMILHQEQNMRRTSERLFVSQPAISQALQKLRHHFNDELFVKTQNGLKATTFCEELIESLQPHLDGLSNALNHQHEFDPKQLKGTLRIAMSPSILSCLAGKVFHTIREAAPNVDIHLLNWSSTTLNELTNDELSLGINYDLQHAPKDLIRKKLIDLSAVLYMRKDHPITKDIVTPYDIEPYDIASLIIPDYNTHKTAAEQIMAQYGLKTRIGFRSELPMAIIDVIQHTDMVYPDSSLIFLEDHPKLKRVALELNNVPLTYSMQAYYHKKHKDSETTRWLRKLMEQLLLNTHQKSSLSNS